MPHPVQYGAANAQIAAATRPRLAVRAASGDGVTLRIATACREDPSGPEQAGLVADQARHRLTVQEHVRRPKGRAGVPCANTATDER